MLSVPTFQNLAKQNKFQAIAMFTIGETVGLAEWIIDDPCLVLYRMANEIAKKTLQEKKLEKQDIFVNKIQVLLCNNEQMLSEHCSS